VGLFLILMKNKFLMENLQNIYENTVLLVKIKNIFQNFIF